MLLLSWMALNGLCSADVPLRKCSLTDSLIPSVSGTDVNAIAVRRLCDVCRRLCWRVCPTCSVATRASFSCSGAAIQRTALFSRTERSREHWVAFWSTILCFEPSHLTYVVPLSFAGKRPTISRKGAASFHAVFVSTLAKWLAGILISWYLLCRRVSPTKTRLKSYLL